VRKHFSSFADLNELREHIVDVNATIAPDILCDNCTKLRERLKTIISFDLRFNFAGSTGRQATNMLNNLSENFNKPVD
jgi:hypothetical protein